MKVVLIKGIAGNTVLPFKSQSIEVDYWNPILCLLDITDADDLTSIEVNGVFLDYGKHDQEIYIDIPFIHLGSADVRIICADVRVRYSFVKRENTLLDTEILEEMSDFSRTLNEFLSSGRATLKQLFDGIQNKQINLLSVVEPITGVDDKSILEDIKNALPYAKGICTNPRLQLRTKYELMDVELAKRITSHSMQHLAAHSEHWKARTITGLVPKRIIARTSEDNLNIYENLFFGKVINTALYLVAKKQRDTMQALSQKAAIIDWNKYSKELWDPKKIVLLQKMFPDFNQDDIEFTQLELQEYQKLLEKIERGLTTIVSSQFYKSLETVNIKNFPLPVRATNILKMDSRYRKILKLWTQLQACQKQVSAGFEGSLIDPSRCYVSYVALLLIYGLYNEGYSIDESSSVNIVDNLLSFKTSIHFNKIKITIEIKNVKRMPYVHVSFEEKQLYRIPYDLSYPIDELKSYYPNDILQDNDNSYVTLIRLDSKDIVKKFFRKIKSTWITNQVDLKAESKIKYWDRQWQKRMEDAFIEFRPSRKNSLGIFPLWGTFKGDDVEIESEINQIIEPFSINNFDNLDNMMFVLPFDTNERTLLRSKSQKLMKRLINYGESYEPNDKKFANYRIGMLPVSQRDLSSVQRLVKTVNLHRKRLMLEWGLASNECPVCGSNEVIENGKDSFKCLKCKALFAKPKCKHCGHQFGWIMTSVKVNKDYFIDDDSPIIKKLLHNENVLGNFVITDFSIEMDKNGSDVHFPPRCPHCGNFS